MIASRWIPRYFDMWNRELDRLLSRVKVPEDVQVVRSASSRSELPKIYGQMKHIMNMQQCKRMMFDSRQAAVFDVSDPIKVDGEKIRPPFGCFWMELTEPIKVQAQQPGYEDSLVGMIFMEDAIDGSVLMADGKFRKLQLSQIVFVFYNEQTKQWVDRAWSISLADKKAITTMYSAKHAGEWRSTVDENDVQNSAFSRKLDGAAVDVIKDGDTKFLFQAGMEIPGNPNREITWWESAIQDYTEMLLWILAYCMAKSVKIEEMKLARQQRRALEREGIVPRPWHRVFVEPKLVERIPSDGESGREVGYRFDVIGHLRFNKHKMLDGSYRHTVEWVPDHMRGLKHDVYIPKTYAVQGGSKNIPENKAYFPDDSKLHGGTRS